MAYIYVAGPLFTPGERLLLEQVDSLCKQAGHTTYLPHRDAGLFDRGTASSRAFFENDLDQLKRCEGLVAVLNGLETDAGTCWELGYFYSLERPILAYMEDSRIFDPGRQINPMLVNSIDHLAHSLGELKELLTRLA